MRKIFTTRITLASLFVEAVLFPSDVQTCDARWTSQDNKKMSSVIMTLSTCNYSKVPNQVEVHIHEGPGNTRDAVEPEA
jgi:hypothetical protein